MIDPNLIDVTTIQNLPTGAFDLSNFVVQSNTSGLVTKNTQSNFAAFIAPYVAAIGSSGYVNVTSNALPTPAGSNIFSVVGNGIYTHSGGNVSATGDLNIIYWNGTIWSLAQAITVDLSTYETKEDLNIKLSSEGINLVDPSTVQLKKDIDNFGTTVTSPDRNVYRIDNLIGSQSYNISYTQNTGTNLVKAAFFEADGTVLGVVPFFGTDITFNQLPDISYMTFSIDEDATDIQLEIGNSASPFSAYNPYLLDQFLLKKNAGVAISNLAGKKVLFVGDSMVEADLYQPLLAERLGFSYLNSGVGGSTLTPGFEGTSPRKASFVERLSNVMPTYNPDFVIIAGGFNDVATTAVPLGNRNDLINPSFDGGGQIIPASVVGASFYGSLNHITRYLSIFYPTVKVYYVTFHKWFTDVLSEAQAVVPGMTQPQLDDILARQITFSEAMINSAGDGGKPCVNLFKNSQMNYRNIVTYTGADRTHINSLGAELYVKQILPVLNS